MAIANIQEKIWGCGINLHAWGSSKTHPDTEEIKLQKHVERLNADAPTEESKAAFLEVSRKLDDLLAKQEIYWHQRSRLSWLRHRDINTRFFHSKASQRKRRNFIQGIREKQQSWVEEIEDIARVATKYFESIFSSGGCY